MRVVMSQRALDCFARAGVVDVVTVFQYKVTVVGVGVVNAHGYIAYEIVEIQQNFVGFLGVVVLYFIEHLSLELWGYLDYCVLVPAH